MEALAALPLRNTTWRALAPPPVPAISPPPAAWSVANSPTAGYTGDDRVDHRLAFLPPLGLGVAATAAALTLVCVAVRCTHVCEPVMPEQQQRPPEKNKSPRKKREAKEGQEKEMEEV